MNHLLKVFDRHYTRFVANLNIPVHRPVSRSVQRLTPSLRSEAENAAAIARNKIGDMEPSHRQCGEGQA